MFDPYYPPIPWVTSVACHSRGGNHWRLLKPGEQFDGRIYRAEDLTTDSALHRDYAYDPGWQDRLPVKWYAVGRWREYEYGPVEADTYDGAILKAVWRVICYRLVTRHLLNQGRLIPRWCGWLGMS